MLCVCVCVCLCVCLCFCVYPCVRAFVAGLRYMYIYAPAGFVEHVRRSKGNRSCFISRLYYNSIRRQACVCKYHPSQFDKGSF